MNRQLYGIGNLVNREKYGLGSDLKKFVRNIIPDELSKVAVKVAPFVAPFNPALAAGMAGLGSFDLSGSLTKGLTSAGLTYGGGQLARYVGGAGIPTTGEGFLRSLNPFAGADFSQGITSGLGSLFTSPIGTQSGLQLGQYFQSPSMEFTTGNQTVQKPIMEFTTGKQEGTLDQLKTIFSPSSSVDLSTRVNTAINLTGDAIKNIYTDPRTGKVDFRAVISTISLVPSFLDAKKKAQEAGIPPDQFNEEVFNREKAMFQTAYQSRLPMEAFGIRKASQMGGIINATEEQPIFPRLEVLNKNLGQAEQTLGEPSSQFNASSITTAITGQQPQGFAQGGLSDDVGGLLSIKLTPAMAMGGRIDYETGGPTTTTPTKTLPMDLDSLARRLFNTNLDNLSPSEKQYLYEFKEQNKTKKAKGGIMGSEIPVRQNPGGITELDLRAKGGYIPVGIKEKADDVPAMLSKNEFVFTADAVRGAGDGNINKGAQKMYKLMKSLEKKVKKIKKVA